MSPPRLGCLEIAAEDVAAAAAAWQRCLGIEFRAADGEGFLAHVGGVELRLVPAGDGLAGLRGLVLEVDELTAAVGKMATSGIETTSTTVDDEARPALVLDPHTTFGVPITLREGES